MLTQKTKPLDLFSSFGGAKSMNEIETTEEEAQGSANDRKSSRKSFNRDVPNSQPQFFDPNDERLANFDARFPQRTTAGDPRRTVANAHPLNDHHPVLTKDRQSMPGGAFHSPDGI